MVWKFDAPAGEKIVLLKMADCANDQGQSIFPTKAAIARDCCCSTKHVQNVWAKYRASGLLVCGSHAGGRGKATVYSFNIEALKGATDTPYQRVKGEQVTGNTVPPLPQRENVTALKGERRSLKGANDGNPPAPPIRINHQEPSLTVKGGGVGGGVPQSLDTPEFREAWERWVTFRREDRHALTPSTVDAQLKKLEKAGPVVAVAMIDQSIEQGWQGLFPPKGAAAASTMAQSAQDNLKRLEARLSH